jgi:ketosteroid isomerase-like protein
MSQEKLAIVRREYRALAARDWVAVAEVWHPEVELEADESAPGAGVYPGLEEITQFFDTWAEPYREYRVEADEILEAGDQVVVAERFAGRGLRGSESEAWLEGRLFRVITFREGRIWRVKEYPSRAEALEVAGLRE